MTRLFRQSSGFVIRAPYPLPKKRVKPKLGVRLIEQKIFPRHRRFVKSYGCCVTGCEATQVDFAHIRDAANSGVGLKPHDRYGIGLCRSHHREQHDCGVWNFQDRHGVDLYQLAAEFVRRSPDWKLRIAVIEQDRSGT